MVLIRTIGRNCLGPPPPVRGTRRAAKRGGTPDGNRRVAPLSPELWHHTAYPAEPEATWAQPLTREELSCPWASFDVRGQWPISVQTPHLARCLLRPWWHRDRGESTGFAVRVRHEAD